MISSIEKSHHSPHRIHGIDGLRAVAVLSVFLFHLNHSFLPGGFVGVDVFFVISGYVVCGSLLKDSSSHFLSFIGAFYVRRILRIYPALIVLLLTTGILSALFIPQAYLSELNARVGLWAFFGLSNIALAIFHNAYFSPTNDFNPYAHTWTLGVEEQYYFIFPFLLFFILRYEGRIGIARLAVTILLPTLLLLSLFYSIGETLHRHDYAYYLLPSRFWELAAGAFLCMAHHKKHLLPSFRHSALLVISGLLVLIISVIAVDPRYFPFPLAIPPVLGTMFCIAGLVVPQAGGFGTKILTLPIVVGIGRISYSLYLWHWVVIVLMRWTIGEESIFSYLITIILTFVLSVFSYRFLEIPFQRTNSFFQKRRVIALTGCCLLILVSCRAYKVIVSTRFQNYFGLSIITRNHSDWYPELGDGQPGPMFSGTVGRHWSGRRIFIIGDSHASAYSSLFEWLRKEDGVSVYLDSLPAARVGSLVYPEDSYASARKEAILQLLTKYSHAGDVVFLAHLRVQRLCQQWGSVEPEESALFDVLGAEPNRLLAVQQGEEFIQKLQKLKLEVIIEAPLPIFRTPPFRCSDWFNKMNPIAEPGFTIDRDFLLARRAPAMKSIQEVQMQLKGVHMWDPFPTLCPDAICSAFDNNNKPLFFDGDHLSGYGGQKLYPSFKKTLEKVWSGDSS